MRNSLINLRVDAAVSLSDVYDNSLGPFLTNLILASDNDNHSSQTEDTDSVETKRKDLEPGEPDCEHVFGEYTVTSSPIQTPSVRAALTPSTMESPERSKVPARGTPNL